MSIWGKLFTAVRGGVNDVAEAVVDSQDLRILDQEIRDGEAALAKARADLATLMGKERISFGKLEQMKVKYDQDIGMLDKLVSGNREPDLQNQLADRIATLEAEVEKENATYREYRKTRELLEQTVASLTVKINQVKRDVDKVKVTASVQSAQKAIMAHGAGINSKVGGAAATLARIKEKQLGQAATFEAQEAIDDAMSGTDLDRQLAAAGVATGPGTASSVLERARAKALAAPSATLAISN